MGLEGFYGYKLLFMGVKTLTFTWNAKRSEHGAVAELGRCAQSEVITSGNLMNFKF